MSDFDELWEGSLEFQGLFVGNGRIFPDWDSFDEQTSRALWAARKPLFRWKACGINGCRVMVHSKDRCPRHLLAGGKLPMWRWINGRLFKSIAPRNEDTGKDTREKGYREYESYEKYVARQKYGVIPIGWEIGRLNGNPFDMSSENVIIMTKLSMVAVAAGYISPKQAPGLDNVVAEFVANQMGRGARPFIGTYGYNDIARIARCKVAAVRRESREGTLDPGDLRSVVDFALRRRYGGKVKLVADGQG